MIRDKAMINTLILGSDEFLFKCVLLLHEHQTELEQDSQNTHEDNGQGFNKADAHNMSKYAVLIQQDVPLTLSELADMRRRIKKYVTQLSNYLTEEDLEL